MTTTTRTTNPSFREIAVAAVVGLAFATCIALASFAVTGGPADCFAQASYPYVELCSGLLP